jgi:hypothetical protein
MKDHSEKVAEKEIGRGNRKERKRERGKRE